MLGAIWAQSVDGVIGDGQTVPWHITEDLAHFKQITMSYPVVMGRKTWESIPAKVRPLPGRRNIVVCSREPGDWSEGASVIANLPDFSAVARDAWVIGGARLYRRAVEVADVIELTLVDAVLKPVVRERAVIAPEIPAGFSKVSDSGWLESPEGRLTVGISDMPLKYRFLRYEREETA